MSGFRSVPVMVTWLILACPSGAAPAPAATATAVSTMTAETNTDPRRRGALTRREYFTLRRVRKSRRRDEGYASAPRPRSSVDRAADFESASGGSTPPGATQRPDGNGGAGTRDVLVATNSTARRVSLRA